MSDPNTTYRVTLVTHRGDTRPIEPDEPFTTIAAARLWALAKMNDPRYTRWWIEQIDHTARAAFSRGIVDAGFR